MAELSVPLICGILATALVLRWYRMPQGGRWRWVPLALRLMSLLLVSVMLSGWTHTRFQRGKADLIVLIDNSISMQQVDVNRSTELTSFLSATRTSRKLEHPSRFDLLCAILEDPRSSTWKQLRRRYDLSYCLLDSHIPATHRFSSSSDNWKPDWKSSPIATRIRDLVQQSRDRPLAGLVLLSDGLLQDTADWSTAARAATEQGVPVYSIAVGANHRPPGITLGNLSAPRTAYVGDTVHVEVTLRSLGFQGETVTVGLDDVDSTAEVTHEQITIDNSTMERQVRLSFRHDKAGPFRGAIVLRPMAHAERRTEEQIPFEVEFLDEPLRVLLVADQPNYEYRALKTVLSRYRSASTGKPAAELHCYLQSASSAYSASDSHVLSLFPQTREELAPYDIIVWCDADLSQLTEPIQQALRDSVVREGRGWVWISGPQHIPQSLYHTAWETLWGCEQPQDSVSAGPQGFTLQPTEFGRQAIPTLAIPQGHPTRDIPYFWRPSLGPLRPSARVLAESHANDRPGAAFQPAIWLQFAGQGQILSQAMQESWRWKAMDDATFVNYWIPLLRLLRPRHDALRLQPELTPAQATVSEGATVRLVLRIPASERSRFESVTQVWVEAVDHAGRVAPLVTPADRTPQREAEFQGLPAGKYRARLLGLPPNQSPTCEFQVTPADRESVPHPADYDSLARLATATGGRFYPWPKFADLFRDLPHDVPTPLIALPAQTIWNRWPAVVLLVSLLTLEWILRRRWGAP